MVEAWPVRDAYIVHSEGQMDDPFLFLTLFGVKDQKFGLWTHLQILV